MKPARVSNSSCLVGLRSALAIAIDQPNVTAGKRTSDDQVECQDSLANAALRIPYGDNHAVLMLHRTTPSD